MEDDKGPKDVEPAPPAPELPAHSTPAPTQDLAPAPKTLPELPINDEFRGGNTERGHNLIERRSDES